jgi:hypothetical protein
MRCNGRGKPLRWRFREAWLDTRDVIDVLPDKIKSGDFKWSQIWDFISGTYRFYFPELVRKKVMRQIDLRYKMVKKECVERGSCGKCGCDLPEVMYASKGCYCYPKIKLL